MALVELRVTNLAVLLSARMAPGSALTALTGETGSGKSLCITALRLALGARVDGDLVRAGAATATVAAVFDDVPTGVRARLEAVGIDHDDDLLTLSREIPGNGRGVCRINGALVAQGVLRSVGEALVEVTAQGESHRLLRAARQRSILDAYGGGPLAAAAERMAGAFLSWREAEDALARARAGAVADATELERAGAVVADLAPVGIRPGEADELGLERRRLRSAGGLRTTMDAVRAACTGIGDNGGAADAVAAALARGSASAGLDPRVDAVLDEAAIAVERLRELASAARAAADAIEVDEVRLVDVEERLALLDRVRRRFGGSLEAAAEALARATEVVARAEAGGGAIATLEAAAAMRRAAAATAAHELSRLRAAAAQRLERAVTERLRCLRLPAARFRVVTALRDDPAGVLVDGRTVACGTDGADVVEFRFAAAGDGIPLPLEQGASGGELSRVALAVRAVVALADDCPTLVLDEVDTGLGGETAARVGEALAAIGLQRQLIVVTHRAEIAARADDHVVVRRIDGPRGAEASARRITGDDRVTEIARLMSGRPTAAAVARAAELLVEGRPAASRAVVPTMAPR